MATSVDGEEIGRLQSAHGPHDPARASVIAGQGDVPVVVLLVQVLEEASRRIGGFERVKALIDLPVDAQPEQARRRGHELPGSAGAGPRRGVDPEAAFDDRQVGQVLGESVAAEDLLEGTDELAHAVEGPLDAVVANGLEGLQEGDHLRIDDHRQAVGDDSRLADLMLQVLDVLFRRQEQRRGDDLIEKGLVLAVLGAVLVLQVVQLDIGDLAHQTVQRRVAAIPGHAGVEHHVQREVEIFLGPRHVPLFQAYFAALENGLGPGHRVWDRVGGRNGARRRKGGTGRSAGHRQQKNGERQDGPSF